MTPNPYGRQNKKRYMRYYWPPTAQKGANPYGRGIIKSYWVFAIWVIPEQIVLGTPQTCKLHPCKIALSYRVGFYWVAREHIGPGPIRTEWVTQPYRIGR